MSRRSQSRVRGGPCFCGSGDAFKYCCARSLTDARTIDNSPMGRLRVWRVSDAGAHRFAAPEVIEHVERGEFAWLAGDLGGQFSWMLDDAPLTLLELLDNVMPPATEWVIEQTVALLKPVLGQIATLEAGDGGEPVPGALDELAGTFEADADVAQMGELMEEFLRLGATASAFTERMAALAEELGLESDEEGTEQAAA
jgi:SEC-C motif